MRADTDLFTYAIDRTVGSPLVHGNAVRLLRDASENYPAWLAAIESARRYIYFESYIIYDDDIGGTFADALCAKAAAGVRVRLVYDWLGAFTKTPGRFWRRLQQGGVEVRCYNRPRIWSPFGWLQRDHRKLLSVDGEISFITGLCVGESWAGDAERGVAPWRDTGIEVRGPAVASVERAFIDLWGTTGSPVPDAEPVPAATMGAAGDVTMRVVATTPGTAGMLRLDQMVAASARSRLWLADAYFAGIPTYVQALAGAARDGVDVRLLVPGSSDIALLRPISMVGYRPLLQAGVRVFEWKGPMMHAKTAVADGRWARVGSSNLNLASWLGNHELDAVIENERFAREMEEMYCADLENSTEIVLYPERRSTRSWFADRRQGAPRVSVAERARGSAGRATAGALRFSNAVAAAITDRRVLASAEARLITIGGIILIAIAIIAVLFPMLIIVPLVAITLWLGVVLVAKGSAMRRGERRRRELWSETDANATETIDKS